MPFPPKNRAPTTTKKTPRVPQPTQMIAKLFTTVFNNKDDESEHGTTRSGDEDEFLVELVKEYESDDTVADNLKSELAKLV